IRQCQQETATILVWLATSWHRETVGSKEQPGTNDKKTMRMASQLYELLLKKFPDLEKMKFPTIDRRDWPTRYRIAYYHAELLWKMGDWVQCGPAFDKVVELNPKGEYTSDAAYAAVLCYNNLYQQQYQGTETQTLSARKEDKKRGRRGRAQEKEEEPSYASRPFTKVEKGMLNAFRRYICYVQNSDELPTVKYRRARIYYEANRFEEAALMFQDIAWNHRDSDLAEYAANLYLDSLNVLGTKLKMPRPACVGEIANALEPLSKFYCASSEAAEEHADLCKVVGQLRCDVMRTQAESYTKAGEHKKAAATYVKVFRKYRECGKLDEVLYNAAISFEAARLLGRAIQVRNVLIQQYPKSSLSKKALFLIGANFHALAYYDRAAQYYEQFATKYPRENGAECTEEDKKNNTCAVAHEALMNAVFFRLGLGQDEKAIEDARLFEANYRRTLPAQTSQVVFSLGSIHKKRKTWYKLVEHYRDYLKSYRRRAMPHQVIQANVESGKAFWVRSDKRRAEEYFRKAVGAWRGGAEKAINGMDLPASEKALHLYEAKEATSEALFYLAEYKYAEFLRVRFPRYSKGRSLAQVNAWAKSKFKPWVERKRKALVAAEKEYNEIAKLKVPAWEIAAAARVGEMYRSFVDEFRDAPVPKEIESDPELFDIYVGALDEQSEPLQKVAIDKFEFCLITSTRVRWFNRWSRQCELELNKLSPQNYPLAAELRGDAQHEKDTLAQPGKAELGRESESLLGPRAASEPEQATALQGGRS
ncbi:MAG: tetratricopeptide repeat protein, partial [Polyangiales bacterium]